MTEQNRVEQGYLSPEEFLDHIKTLIQHGETGTAIFEIAQALFQGNQELREDLQQRGELAIRTFFSVSPEPTINERRIAEEQEGLRISSEDLQIFTAAYAANVTVTDFLYESPRDIVSEVFSYRLSQIQRDEGAEQYEEFLKENAENLPRRIEYIVGKVLESHNLPPTNRPKENERAIMFLDSVKTSEGRRVYEGLSKGSLVLYGGRMAGFETLVPELYQLQPKVHVPPVIEPEQVLEETEKKVIAREKIPFLKVKNPTMLTESFSFLEESMGFWVSFGEIEEFLFSNNKLGTVIGTAGKLGISVVRNMDRIFARAGYPGAIEIDEENSRVRITAVIE